MKLTLENLKSNNVQTVDIDPENINNDTSKILGFKVECLDNSKGWFYFWELGVDSDGNDAAAVAYN